LQDRQIVKFLIKEHQNFSGVYFSIKYTSRGKKLVIHRTNENVVLEKPRNGETLLTAS